MATAAAFLTLVTTNTGASSLVVGGATPGSTTGTGGINAGKITLSAGIAISGGTLTDAGIVIPSIVPASTSNCLYNNSGTLTWNGAPLATGSSVSGTTGTICKFTASNAVGDSIITESGAVITVTGTLNATAAIQLNGANINTGGTLTNVAYLDQAQTFAAAQTFGTGISTSGGTPSDAGIMIPTGTPSVTTTNLYNTGGNLTWPLQIRALTRLESLQTYTDVSLVEASYATMPVLVQINGSSSQGPVFYGGGATASGVIQTFARSRSTDGSTAAVVHSGDVLGGITFVGDDGTDLVSVGATIRAEVDGTPGSNDMPGRLLFLTTADGAATATERLRIASDGLATFANQTAFSDDMTLATLKKLYFGSGSDTWLGETTTDQLNCQAGGSGGCYVASGGTTWTAVSDERLKLLMNPIVNAVEKVKTVRTMIGRFLVDEPTKRRAFFVAQDWQSILPEVIEVDPQTGMMGMNYEQTSVLLAAALKEVIARVEKLEKP